MHKNYFLTLLGVLLAGMATGQVKKQFAVENTDACESIKLQIKANSGNCYIKPSQNTDILNVFSNQSEEAFSHNFIKTINGKVCDVKLSLEELNQEGFGQSISSRVFNASETSVRVNTNSGHKFWKMYLSDAKTYALEMNYGFGNANVDLSGLSIKKLKINSGSADVNVGYLSGIENQVEMDTFYVKVDLGSVNVKNLSLAKTRYLLADVGFGNMALDFSESPTVSNTIKGSVGAGNLIITLPKNDTPVLVKIHDSWLCSVKMPSGFKKIAENTFVSTSYTQDSKVALTFDLDVSMGSITFK
ncbi:hypothetical protein SanaruYs_24170 [Chryseotalea sanaruensis]|uniref:Adhesin domain-containing protein n=1 Tax=Chryseotalea sanaruensis TaxID=2482724 RepID=A0A401UBB9_9BACT|nr:hypothetical protein [Chryseotalea sanaruensis]GCC52181.1 hypothetical protein SanaruYs_24170 [Chryseotalea sanaruensis]